MHRINPWILALAFCAATAQAQMSPPDPDWKETEAPPPPQLRTDHLVKIELPESALKFGVDPASVAIGRDGIVRYVVVASSSTGVVNAFYEGLRCSTAEVRVYARHNPDSGWVQVKDSRWQSLHEARPSRHSLVIARNGACVGGAPNQNAAQVVRDLGGSANWRFWNN
ncbi:MAG: hypothetical protein JWQ33_2960 [Ramlibacter sp.]|nr:hypothetical protein [Ramlibacter sp.]